MPSTEVQIMSVQNTAWKADTFTHYIVFFKPVKTVEIYNIYGQNLYIFAIYPCLTATKKKSALFEAVTFAL